MKTIRRTRITIKEREVVIVKSGETRKEDHTVCPVCKSHIHIDPTATATCLPEDTQEEDKKLLKVPE
jgi:hypothetical protein